MTLKASCRVLSGPLASASLQSAALEASMNIDVGRDFLDIAGGFKDRDKLLWQLRHNTALQPGEP